MIGSFRDKETERIASGEFSRRFPAEIQIRAKALLDRLRAASSLDDLTVPRSLRLEKLKGMRRGQFSIRVNTQYQICFFWIDNEALHVELTDYH